MKCYVYRSQRKPQTYLYIAKQDDFTSVPDTVMQVFGEAQLVMELELTVERQLARTTGIEVMQAIKEQGFYLQMPPGEPDTSI